MIVITMNGFNSNDVKKKIKDRMQKMGLACKTRINILTSTVEPCEGTGYASYVEVKSTNKYVEKLGLVKNALEKLGLDVL